MGHFCEICFCSEDGIIFPSIYGSVLLFLIYTQIYRNDSTTEKLDLVVKICHQSRHLVAWKKKQKKNIFLNYIELFILTKNIILKLVQIEIDKLNSPV